MWDLRSRHILRALPKKFPLATALEWCPTHNPRSMKRRQSSKEECLLDATRKGTSSAAQTPTGPPLERIDSAEKIVTKEYFVFSDVDSQLYHFTVEGHALKDGVKIPPEVS